MFKLLRFRRKKHPKPKLAEPGMDFKGGRVGGDRISAVAPEFERFANQNSKVFSRTIELINNNFEKFLMGKKIKDTKAGISIKHDYTGVYNGDIKEITLRVTAAGRDFFVKTVKRRHAERMVYASQIADEFLKRGNYKFEGYNVKVIKPLLVYQTPIGEGKVRTYVVTDFYDKSEVEQLEYYGGSDAPHGAMWRLGVELDKRGVREAHSENAFYNPKTKTILLFDLLTKE